MISQLSACSFVEFDTSIICHVLVHFFWLISIARYVFKSPSICFWGTKYDIYCKHVAYLHSTIVTPGPAVIRTVPESASTIGRFLSRISHLPTYVFLRRRRSFTSRKLYACLEKSLCLSCTLWSSLCFWSSMYRFILLWSLWYHRIQM